MPSIEPRDAEVTAARNGAVAIISVCALASAVLGACMSDKCPREVTPSAPQRLSVKIAPLSPAQLELEGYSAARNHMALCDTDSDCLMKYPQLGDGGPYPLEGEQLSERWYSESNPPTPIDLNFKRPQ